MGDHDNSRAEVAAEAGEQLQNLLTGSAVESSCGLVTEEKGRVFAQGPCNGNSLLLAAGELRGKVVHPLPQPHLLQHLPGIESVAADLPGQLHILQRRQVLHQVIKLKDKPNVHPPVFGELPVRQGCDLLAADGDGAGGGPVHPAEQIQAGGFARAGVPVNHAELALVDGKGHMVGCMDHHFTGDIIFADGIKFNIAHDQDFL